MGLSDRLADALSADRSEIKDSTDSTDDHDEYVRWDKFGGCSPREIEEIFEGLAHNQRIDCVDPNSRRIPRSKWWHFSSYLNRNHEANMRWGLNQSHTEPRDGLRVCIYDDAPVEKRPVKNREGESTSSTEKEQTERRAWFRMPLSIGVRRTSTQEGTETGSEEQTRSKEIVECETNRGDCKLNRHALVKYGRECIARGSGNRDQLDADINRVAEEVGTDHDQSGDQQITEGSQNPTPES
jgi:hypothetical protein